MSIRNLLFKKQSYINDPLTLRQDDIARVAITEDGIIIHASSAFYDLTHSSPNQKALKLNKILKFIKNDQSLALLKNGIHKVWISGNKEEFDFHFNWFTASNNRRYLIGSQILDIQKVPSKTAIKKFATQLQMKNEANILTSQINENDLYNFLNTSSDVMIVINNNGTILRINNSFSTIFNDVENIQNFTSLFVEDEKLYIRNTLRTLISNTSTTEKQTVNFDAKIQTNNANNRWMEWRLNKKEELIYCIGRDITDIKTHEKALIRQEEQLNEAESIGRMGRWHWTVGENTLSWSDEIYRIFGVEQDSFEPTLQGMNNVINRRDIDRVNQAFQRAIIEQNNYDMEFRIIRPDGETRFIRCEGRCALDEEEDVIALYGIMQDMTQRTLYEQELEAAKDAAERAYATKTQFLTNMSHELRTPLNAIIGFSEMMQRQILGPIGTEKYLEYLSGIHESGKHLLDLIGDILDMSKIEAGKYELVLEEININKILKQAAHMMEGRAHESDVTIITKQLQNENLLIVADRRAILQIILNLLSNAIKFTLKGGEINIECYEREDYIILKIIDNGIGIPANKLAQITRPFEQASSSYAREHEGSGLGLAITKELAEIHGGALRIESIIDEGTTVTIRLPIDAIKATKKEKEKAEL
ncbi:MAG: PAS domain-containing sensor histidine kinase [Alphaproteobacteria bacterium]|nr:PAS domain-containing sensor histidine kinase [Alphaproteobacteria bacterium]